MIYDTSWNEVTDVTGGTVEIKTKQLVATYNATTEGEGEYVTIKEYPNGGKDVEWQWTVEPEGEWVFKQKNHHKWTGPTPPVQEWWNTNEAYDCTLEYGLFTPYTEGELEAQATEAACTITIDDLLDAITELSQMVSDMQEASNG